MAIPLLTILARGALMARNATAVAAGKGVTELVTKSLLSGAAWETGAQIAEWIWGQWDAPWDPNADSQLPSNPGSTCLRCNSVREGLPENGLGFFAEGDPDLQIMGGFQYITKLHSWKKTRYDPERNSTYYQVKWTEFADRTYDREYAWPGTTEVICMFIAGNRAANDYVPEGCDGWGGDDPPGDVPGETIYFNEGDCTYKATWQMFIVDKDGNATGDVVLIEPDDRGFREGVENCEITPTFIYQPVNGGPDQIIDPHNPDGSTRTLEEIAQEIEGTISDAVDRALDEVKDKLDSLIPDVPGGSWTLQGVCETDTQGNKLDPQPTQTWAYEGGPATVVANNQLQLVDNILQQHLNWKTPTCNERPPKEGDWVTIEFMSDENSPMGDRRLRKLFRYRSKGGKDLGQLIDYWKDFTWSAGPVCVIHSGSWWGTPQSWASSAGEGKRLIQYAAAEAGIDPDQVGKWTVSGSDNPRLGMPGLMRVRMNKGTYCITNRLGSSGLPLVGVVSTDP